MMTQRKQLLCTDDDPDFAARVCQALVHCGFDVEMARDGAMLFVSNGSAAPILLREREKEALTWAARGKTSAEIAQILGLSKRTVDFHLDNARCKLGVATRTQAVMKAASGQLINP
jgi:DNA-binding CsgD family transcriptional regulator